MQIENYTENTIKLDIPAKYAVYVPRMQEQHCSFIIHGINNAIAGAIIRTIGGEMMVKYLRCDVVKTNDRFIIDELVVSRIQSIPIKQSLTIGTKFNLNYVNKSQFLETIKTNQFDGYPSTGPVPFNQNITICKINKVGSKDDLSIDYSNINERKNTFVKKTKATVKSKKELDDNKSELKHETKDAFLTINCVVAQAPSYIPGFGNLSLSHHCSAIPIEDAFDQYAVTGVRTSISNATSFTIEFDTHGTISPKELLIAACDNIIDRITRVNDFIPMKTSLLDMHTYCIIDESMTIGNLFTREIANDQTIKSISHKMGLDTRVLYIIIASDNNTDPIIINAIKTLIDKFEKIKKLL